MHNYLLSIIYMTGRETEWECFTCIYIPLTLQSPCLFFITFPPFKGLWYRKGDLIWSTWQEKDVGWFFKSVIDRIVYSNLPKSTLSFAINKQTKTKKLNWGICSTPLQIYLPIYTYMFTGISTIFYHSQMIYKWDV